MPNEELKGTPMPNVHDLYEQYCKEGRESEQAEELAKLDVDDWREANGQRRQYS